MSKRMYHPCHKLSVPSAKLFWCRHCMQMFEDAISRWKHSKKCHASPGYKPKDQDARVVQLYVKPDKVSYTSNVTPGQTVYHKPHVKKTSTDLKCVICGTKFYSLYDMRKHVKEPCQKSDNSVASTQIEFGDKENDTESFSSLKIRRVEAEEDDKSGVETALSVLAEASKHVESLSHTGEVILEQVIEEVPQVIEHFAQTSGDQFAWYQFVDKATEENLQQEQVYKEVVVAYPRPQVKPELGTIVVSLQSEDGNQLLQNDLELETIQECVKDTASALSIGQIIQIQLENTDKYRHFVVGLQGVIWPLEENSLTAVTQQQKQIENTVQCNTVTPTFFKTEPDSILKPSLAPCHTQVLTNNFENNTINNINSVEFELIKGPTLGSSEIVPQEVVVSSGPTVKHVVSHCDQTSSSVQIKSEQDQSSAGNQSQQQSILQTCLIENQVQSVVGSQTVSTVSEQSCVNQELQTTHSQPFRKPESLVEALLRGSVVITQPTSAQNQTEVAIVEITDGQLRALADQTIVHAYAQNQQWPVENM